MLRRGGSAWEEGQDGCRWGTVRVQRSTSRASRTPRVYALMVLAMAPHLVAALALSHPEHRPSSLPEMAPASTVQRSPSVHLPALMRLRGGGLIDKRTPTYWPMLPEDEIPEDGSVGGHYTMEEVCARGGGEWIGETSPYTPIIGVTLYLIVVCCIFIYWFDKQPWVPEMM